MKKGDKTRMTQMTRVYTDFKKSKNGGLKRRFD